MEEEEDLHLREEDHLQDLKTDRQKTFSETKGSRMDLEVDLPDPVGDLRGVVEEVDFEVDLRPDSCEADLREANSDRHPE